MDDASAVSLVALVVNHSHLPANTVIAALDVAARIFTRAGVAVVWAGDNGCNAGIALLARINGRQFDVVLNLLSPAMEGNANVPNEVTGIATPGGRVASVFPGRIVQMTRTGHATVAELVGHAIAHELGHLLLPRRSHTLGGLMSAKLERDLVARGVLWFSAAEAASIRAEIEKRTR
jgi:hypothetical protein